MKMQKPLTGEQLFLRYAFPCAEDRRISGHIDNEHFARLENLIKTGGTPKYRLLRFCFPHAYRRHREFSQLQNVENRWSLEAVASFWRYHHGHTGNCRVLKAKVAAVKQQPAVVIVRAEKRTFPSVNSYSLPLNIGDFVYLHRRVIIEKA